MKSHTFIPALLIAGALLLLGVVLASSSVLFAGNLETDASANSLAYREYQFFASSTAPTTVATTTTATSTNITAYFDTNGHYDNGAFDIRGAKEVVLFFSRGDTSGQGNSGSSAFEIEVSPDGTNWYDYSDLRAIDGDSTADNYFSRVQTATISAATSTVMYEMDATGYYFIRCIVVETTDGEHTCSATATF